MLRKIIEISRDVITNIDDYCDEKASIFKDIDAVIEDNLDYEFMNTDENSLDCYLEKLNSLKERFARYNIQLEFLNIDDHQETYMKLINIIENIEQTYPQGSYIKKTIFIGY